MEAALKARREQEFRAGGYDPAMQKATRFGMLCLPFPPDANSPAPGAVHARLGDVFFNAEMNASGTRSILDLFRVTSSRGICAASPFTHDQLTACSARPGQSGKKSKARLDLRNTDEAAEKVLTSIEGVTSALRHRL
jgi:hypothetical protein